MSQKDTGRKFAQLSARDDSKKVIVIADHSGIGVASPNVDLQGLSDHLKLVLLEGAAMIAIAIGIEPSSGEEITGPASQAIANGKLRAQELSRQLLEANIAGIGRSGKA
jgi:hypothetical protein